MIDKFDGAHRFLSNFYPVSVRYDNQFYPSVEHAYQAAKTLDSKERSKIRCCAGPVLAKKLGSTVLLRTGWDSTLKIPIMGYLLDQKFLQPVLRKKLKATGDEELIEGNDWGDKFWGQVLIDGKYEGQNQLGKMLMEIRQNIR